MIHILWEYTVKAKKATEFERYYSSSGAWAALFRRSPAYRGTTLLRDAENPGRYLTSDTWDTWDSLRAFQQQFSSEYEQLDRACQDFTEAERCLGVFAVLGDR